MKLRVPKVKKIKIDSIDPRLIARMAKKGYIAAQKNPPPAGGQPGFPGGFGMAGNVNINLQGGYGIPLPVTQKLKIELEERERKEKGPESKIVPEEVRYEGVELPGEKASIKMSSIPPAGREDLKTVNMKCPLIPRVPKGGEKVVAYANIAWNDQLGALVYRVIEPRLSAQEKEVMQRVKRELEERLDVNFVKIGEVKAKELLEKEIDETLKSARGTEGVNIESLKYQLRKDVMGLGLIETLMQDPEIEDISCDGVKIPIYVYHRNPKFGSMRTNLMFENKEDLDMFVLKIAQKCGKAISISEPMLDAALPDGSRVQATLGTDIARRGSNFTIRKFTFYPLTPTHMVHYKTLSPMQLAYLWLAIENGKSILISGGTATGKTSLLNALSMFIKPDLKILSIEDTPELRLPHLHWIPEVARSPLSIKGKTGEVTLFDLLKSSLRQRPDYLVVGEVRGREAFVMFQQIATGHPSLATMHAASMPQLIDRLITPPISLPPSLIENIDILIFLRKVKIGNKYVRRANEIIEVVGLKGDRPLTTKIFEWNPAKDDFVASGRSKILEDVGRMLGMTADSVQAEVIRRKRIIEWMAERRTFDYKDVSKVINTYYMSPERLMTTIEGV